MAKPPSKVRQFVDDLRRTLLDLTSRNPLINFRNSSTRTISFVSPANNIGYLLLEKKVISLTHIGAKPIINSQRTNRTNTVLSETVIAQQLGLSTDPNAKSYRSTNKLQTLLFDEDLARVCRRIERIQNAAIQETGAHVLYLCIGYLEYPESSQGTQSYRAPLINIPVRISKTAYAEDAYEISYTGDEIIENTSLYEKISQNYGIKLPSIETDKNTFELDYLAHVRQLVAKIPQIIVHHHVTLATLSFTNMLIYQDLEPSNWRVGIRNTLLSNPIIKQLVDHEQGVQIESNTRDISKTSRDLDIPLIYDADSSQLSAIHDAVNGKQNMVIIGPPGTGKSQTITNLIAAYLSQGKTVLFVAEKLAALEVVKNRLAKAGLDPFLLELHSNKTNKKGVLESIDRRLGYTSKSTIKSSISENHQKLHKNLDQYAQHLQDKIMHLQMNYSELYWRSINIKQRINTQEFSHLDKLYIDNATSISEEELVLRKVALRNIQYLYIKLDQSRLKSYTYFQVHPNTFVDLDEINQVIHTLHTETSSLHATTNELQKLLGSHVLNFVTQDIEQQIQALSQIQSLMYKQFDTNDFMEICISHDDPHTSLNTLKKLRREQSTAQKLSDDIKTQFKRVLPFYQQEYKSLKSSLTYVESNALDLTNCNNLKSWIHNVLYAIANLRKEIQYVVDNSKSLHIQHNTSSYIQQIVSSLSVLDIWNKAKTIDLPLLKSITFTHDLSTKFTKFLTQRQNIRSVYDALITEFYIENDLPSAADIQMALNALTSRHPWIGFIYSDWRNANTFFNRISRNPKEVGVAQRIIQLKQLYEYRVSLDTFLADTMWSAHLHIKPDLFAILTHYHSVLHWLEGAYTNHQLMTMKLSTILEKSVPELTSYIQNMQDMHAHVVKFSEAYTMIASYVNNINDTSSLSSTVNILDEMEHHIKNIAGFLVRHEIPSISYDNFTSTITAWEKLDRLTTKVSTNQDYQNRFGSLFVGLETDTKRINHYIDIAEILYADTLHQDIRHTIVNTTNPIATTSQLFLLFTNTLQLIIRIQKSIEIIDEYLDVHIALRVPLSLAAYANAVHNIVTDINHENFADWIAYNTALRDFELDVDATYVELDIGDDIVHVFNKSALSLHAIHKDSLLLLLSKIDKRATHTINAEIDEILPISYNYGHPAWLWHYLHQGKIDPLELAKIYEYIYFNTFIQLNAEHVFHAMDEETSRGQHSQNSLSFIKFDKQIIKLRGSDIGSTLADNYIPDGNNGSKVDEKTEWALLRYLLPQQRPRMPIRKFMARSRRSIQALKPCFMMSPQSVAQFLDPLTFQFDVVIMDEASQMTPGEALGAIARGKQLVVVGDPKQLPPTQFFAHHNQLESDDIQIESILEWCAQRFDCVRDLRWHYRSQHHTLVAFSNQHFYDNNLHVFPSPYRPSNDLGITTTYVKNAIYQDQINELEAIRIIEQVRSHIELKPKESLGVVTLNIKQRDLISELVDLKLGHLDEYRTFVDYWQNQETPFFVKNLENVQGDERDVIIISTTFGPNNEEKVIRNFGPISRNNGWRRLNVLFTRAKRSIILVTSLRPSNITIHDDSPDGTKAFRAYLEYAFTQDEIDIHTPSIDVQSRHINNQIIPILEQLGYQVTQNLGVAGFAIDMAIKHPHIPGTYIAAILTDGHFYQSSSSVRDRERLHIEILENLGWKGRIFRLWTNEWFIDPPVAQQRLLDFLAPLYRKANKEKLDNDAQLPLYENASTPTTEEDLLARIRSFISAQ